jgi:hypothetical protein
MGRSSCSDLSIPPPGQTLTPKKDESRSVPGTYPAERLKSPQRTNTSSHTSKERERKRGKERERERGKESDESTIASCLTT